MNESLWMYFFMMMGIFGIVMINVFGQVLLSNEQNYYLLKESTEAAMYDAIDLNAYRGDGEWEIGEEGNSCIPKVPGTIKIIREKFVESFARRFANSANLDRQYRVIFNDIDECPPKVSVSLIASERFSMLEIFNVTYNADTSIINNLTGIIEADKKTIDLTKVTPTVDACSGEKTETVGYTEWSTCNYATNTQSRYKTIQYRVGSTLCGTSKEIEEKECFTETTTPTTERHCNKPYTEYTPVVTYGEYGNCNSLTGKKQRQKITEYLDGTVRCKRTTEIEEASCSVISYIIPEEVDICSHPEMFPQTCRQEQVSGWSTCANSSQYQNWKIVCTARGQVCSETPFQQTRWCYSPTPTPVPKTATPSTPVPRTATPSTPRPSTPRPSTPKPTATPSSGGGCVDVTWYGQSRKCNSGCFLKGTKIVTKDGYKDIDKLVVGDLVLTFNEHLNINEYKEVVNTFIIGDSGQDLYTIKTDNTELVVTSNHYIYTNKNGNFTYVYAKDLNIGDVLRYSNGEFHKIIEITSEPLTEIVYNFETEDNHNYYVGDKKILVHNASDPTRE